MSGFLCTVFYLSQTFLALWVSATVFHEIGLRQTWWEIFACLKKFLRILKNCCLLEFVFHKLGCDWEKQLSIQCILKRVLWRNTSCLCIPPRWRSHTPFWSALFHLAASSSTNHTIEKQSAPYYLCIVHRKLPASPEGSPWFRLLVS